MQLSENINLNNNWGNHMHPGFLLDDWGQTLRWVVYCVTLHYNVQYIFCQSELSKFSTRSQIFKRFSGWAGKGVGGGAVCLISPRALCLWHSKKHLTAAKMYVSMLSEIKTELFQSKDFYTYPNVEFKILWTETITKLGSWNRNQLRQLRYL